MTQTFQLIKPQHHYNGPLLLAACVIISMILWMGYDAVIPALPLICVDFGVDASITNLILFPFLLAQAFGQLISGTISDRYGRKIVLNSSMIIFVVCSIICAVVPNIWLLVIVRIPQGFFSGACMILMLTVVTDSYKGRDFDKGVTIMQSMPVIGPIAAPFLGTLMISVWSWHAIFGLLAALGVIALVLVLLMDETLPGDERVVTTLKDNLLSMIPVCKERGFMLTTITIAVVGMVSMAFLAVSSYIYIEEMHTSYLEYSIIYAITAGVGVISPLVYLKVQRFTHENTIAWACLVVMALSGILFLTIGPLAAWGVLVASVPLFFIESAFRAQGFVALTENRPQSRGAANSIATFLYSAVSSVGTQIASLNWPSPIIGIGVMTIACAIIGGILWIFMQRTERLMARYR